MFPKRIFVLLSHSEEILEYLQESPRLKEYEFDGCGISRWVKQDRLNRDEFRWHLEIKIRSFSPNVLIVHTGMTFGHFPAEVVAALISIKLAFPGIRIGLERGAEYAAALIKLDKIQDKTLQASLFRRLHSESSLTVRKKALNEIFKCTEGGNEFADDIVFQMLSREIFDDSSEMKQLIENIFRTPRMEQ